MKTRLIGIVKSAKATKTLRVEVETKVRHPLYGKFVRHRTVCYAHDEDSQAKEDDRVEIIESRPHSKLKRWELVRILPRH
ncbi:30S ribosomal protein S17 [bacterium]|nr:30S ribosomal protein S17 [bacterium]